MSLKSGTHFIGRYEILSPLGAGGMGEVYRAKDLRLGREVAIKVLPEHLASNPEALSRFEREAKAVAALSHPNILAIYDFGSDHDVSFAVMELLEGETLRKRIKESTLPWRKAAEIAVPIAEGLSAAHGKGVTHRDLKPENIFLTSDGQVKILDFGLAQLKPPTLEQELSVAPTQSQVTQTQSVMGTVPYMSPEQVRGVSVDTRSDIFSFGSVLYEMLTGNRAFAGTTAADTMATILKEEPKELDELKKKIPAELERVISHCLEKNPEQRFQTARDLAFDLRAVLSSSEISKTHRTERTLMLRPLLWFGIIAVLFLIGISVYLYIPHGRAVSSLAVLPFANVGNDPDSEYLSDGITESITRSLSQFPKVRVMAHETVFSYKNKHVDPRKIGRELKVDAVVTGKVYRKGDLLTISADLIKVTDGAELWGQQFQRKSNDILSVQDEISSKISEKLRWGLTGEQKKLLVKHYTEDTEAYELYLKGVFFHLKEFSRDDYQKSMEFFQKAIEKDPNYALAYAGLTGLYQSMAFEGLMTPKEANAKSQAAIRKALEIDNTLPEAHSLLSLLAWSVDWNFEESLAESRRALAINPNEKGTRFQYSQNLRAMGRFDEAIAQGKKAQEIDPLSISTNRSLGMTYFAAGKYDQAIEQYSKTIELDPNYAPLHDYLADVYEKKGLYDQAIAEEQKYLRLIQDEEGATTLGRDYKQYGYQKAKRLQFERTLGDYKQIAKEQYVSPLAFATIYANLNEKDEAFAWLDKALQERSPWLTYIKTDPQFDNLHADPRFGNLLRRIGLPL
jgi:serine/threonine protein kinase/tetratricopeptide (TPR) repeat protein